MLNNTIKVMLIVAASLAINTSSFAASPSDATCAAETGAGYGLCTAAWHLGCGTEGERNPNACSKIEDNYFKITGNMPPWLEVCPCWTTAILQAQGPIDVCGDNVPEAPSGATVIGFVNGGFGVTRAGASGCGIATPTLALKLESPITLEEHAACSNQILAVCPNPTN